MPADNILGRPIRDVLAFASLHAIVTLLVSMEDPLSSQNTRRVYKSVELFSSI